MTRAAVYARVSSQAQREKHTIENQIPVLKRFVASQGWTLAGVYIDDGRTAKTGQLDKRDGFAQLCRDADRGVFDVLVVVDIDRLTRTESIEERARILGPFQRNNITIYTPEGGQLDLRTVFGEMNVMMRAIFSAEENRVRAKKIIAGKARAVTEGRNPGGPVPFGLQFNLESGTWSLHPQNAPIVREIYERVAKGESCRAIAADLLARGVPSNRGKVVWTAPTVWRIVRRRFSTGEWVATTRTRRVIKVPPIVSEQLYHAANEALEHSRGRAGGRRNRIQATRRAYLLEGLGTCGACGTPIGVRTAKLTPDGRLISRAAYGCRQRRKPAIGTPKCTEPYVFVDELDDSVWSAVVAELESPGLIAAIQRKATERAANRKDWAADIATHEKHLKRLDQAQQVAFTQHRRGNITEAVLDAELRAVSRERALVERQLDTARAGAALTAPTDRERDPAAWIAALRKLADTADPHTRRQVIRAVIRPGALVLRNGRPTITMVVGGESSGGAESTEVVRSLRLRVARR